MRRIFHNAAARRLREFLSQETAGGMVMIAFGVLAILLANSPVSALYHSFVSYPVSETMKLSSFVKDVLMVVFFLLVGMELKREMLEGALSHKGQKLLPLIAALGGIMVPALIYLAFAHGDPTLTHGWAIPTATDIAFALCVLALAGPRVPVPAKVFLLAIAIYDDLAAILIIAFFYSSGVDYAYLAGVLAISGAMFFLAHRQVGQIAIYLLLGAVLWWLLREAGIHTTVAGVITGMAIPMRVKQNHSPLNNFMHHLHPYVAFGILPIFALVSAGVSFAGMRLEDALAPLPLGIALGLALGKPIGIFFATYATVKLGIAAAPKGVTWSTVLGVAMIAGIGFTMSLFVGFLAFTDDAHHNAVRLGVLMGSVVSALGGVAFLRYRLRQA